MVYLLFVIYNDAKDVLCFMSCIAKNCVYIAKTKHSSRNLHIGDYNDVSHTNFNITPPSVIHVLAHSSRVFWQKN